MRRITCDKLAFEPKDFMYVLPIAYENNENNENDENSIFEKTFNLLMKDCYLVDRLYIKKLDHYIIASYNYEGWADYHMFELQLEIVWLEDRNNLLLLGTIHQDVHDLFEEIIRYKILPIWSKHTGLIDFDRSIL